MTQLAQLQIDLDKVSKRIARLIANSGNINKAELFNTACEAHAITSQLCIEADRIISPQYADDKHWEKFL